MLVSTAEEPEKILNQIITEMSEDLIQLRQVVRTAITSQQMMDLAVRNNNETLAQEASLGLYIDTSASQETEDKLTESKLKEHDHQVTALKPLLWQLETKISEAKMALSDFGGNSDFEQFSGIKKPNSPPSGSSGAEADPDVDGQAFSSIP